MIVAIGISSKLSAHPAFQIDPIDLKVSSYLLQPREYHLKGLVDLRTDLSPVAFIVPSIDSGGQLETVDLKGGAIQALETFMFKSLPRNTSLRPIIVKVKDCKIIESLADPQRGVVEGQVFLDFSFELERGEDLVHLLDFQGGISYKRGVRQFSVIEPILRRSLNNALNYFNDWINREAGQNDKLAKGVVINIQDYRENHDNDTVFYDPQRPLEWTDFKGRPRYGQFQASIFASISYEGERRIEEGQVYVDLIFKTYMLKSSSWVRGANSSYGLNHEQRHFDIAKIVMERLKDKLEKMDLQAHNYDRIVSFHYLEAYREMNRMQEQYDKVTSHGMNASAQEKWDQIIDDSLRSFGVLD
ncbi:MAG: hypothetical protein WD431_17480 [Cyclobacteriaceae bacterium]